jgi:uncharacterized membrane protein
MAGFEDIIATGKGLGLFDFYLPFVLSFAIIYGILRKAKIFGDERVGRTTDLIVAVVLSLFIIGYTPVGVTLATFFGTMFTGTVMIVVTLLGTMMILYMFGSLVGVNIREKQSAKKWTALLILVAIIVAAAAFVTSGGMSFFEAAGVGAQLSLPAMPSIKISAEDVVIFGGAILFLAAVVWMYGGGKESKEK